MSESIQCVCSTDLDDRQDLPLAVGGGTEYSCSDAYTVLRRLLTTDTTEVD